MKKPSGHLIQSRGWVIFFAVLATVLATYLWYDAFDWRGKKMPWPLSGLFWG